MSFKKPLSLLISLSSDRNKASSRVRGFWIAEALELLDVHCTLHWNHSKPGLLIFATKLPKHDIVIFQKTYSRYHRWLMMLAKLLGKRTYLDLDDAPSRTRSAVTLKNIEAMMRMADGVFVGSQNLFEYAKQHQANVYLIPSGIKLEHYRVADKQHTNKKICLGWIGNGAHYKQDLIEILSGPLRVLAKNYPLRFKIVGACGVPELHAAFQAIPGLETDFIDQIEWSDPDKVPKAIEDFDIGLYPLLPNDFNQYKCGFKALEYMATGIPVVSSPTAVNADIISDGKDGLLATSEADWVEALSQLIEDSELRLEMGQRGRRKVESSFDVVKIADQVKRVLNAPRNNQ